MFDHAIFNDCMANVDFCEQMVKDTNPTLLAKAENTAAPHSDIHGYKTIADIMRALNPFTGEFYLETLHVARYTREMYCLFGGRHTHPSTIMPGGCSADITHQTLHRLLRAADALLRLRQAHRADARRPVRLLPHELPGYDMVGFRETNLVNWGSFDDPDYVDYDYRNMTDWGRKRYITPGVAIDGELISTDLVEINLMIRILLGSSYFDGWENEPTFVTHDPLGNPVDKNHPWNKVDAAAAAEARLRRQVQLGRVAADLRQAHRHPRLLRHRRRPVRAPVVHGQGRAGRLRLRQGDRRLDPDGAAPLAQHARDGARVEGPREVQRDRARPRPHLPPGLLGADRAALPGARDQGGAGRAGPRAGTASRSPRAPSAAASTRPPAACSRTTW